MGSTACEIQKRSSRVSFHPQLFSEIIGIIQARLESRNKAEIHMHAERRTLPKEPLEKEQNHKAKINHYKQLILNPRKGKKQNPRKIQPKNYEINCKKILKNEWTKNQIYAITKIKSRTMKRKARRRCLPEWDWQRGLRWRRAGPVGRRQLQQQSAWPKTHKEDRTNFTTHTDFKISNSQVLKKEWKFLFGVEFKLEI